MHVAHSQADVDAFVKQTGAAQHRPPEQTPSGGLDALPGAAPRPAYTPLGLVAQNTVSPLSSGVHALTPLAAAAVAIAASPAAVVTPPLQLTPASAMAEVLPASTPAAGASTRSMSLPPGVLVFLRSVSCPLLS